MTAAVAVRGAGRDKAGQGVGGAKAGGGWGGAKAGRSRGKGGAATDSELEHAFGQVTVQRMTRTQPLPWLGSAGTRGRRSAAGGAQRQLLSKPLLLLRLLVRGVTRKKRMERQMLALGQRKGGPWPGSRCRRVLMMP